jgi:hypothetical protein
MSQERMSANPLHNIEHLEPDLWDAADNLRANSKLTAGEYCGARQAAAPLPRTQRVFSLSSIRNGGEGVTAARDVLPPLMSGEVAV